MIWNVVYHNINIDEIRIVNIFEHSGFKKDTETALEKCKTKEEFAETIRGDLFYRFGSKCEWEVLIKPWCGGSDKTEKKVDVYQQIMWNWDIFIDYLWESRGKRPTKRAAALTK